jgi:hypothetical protein
VSPREKAERFEDRRHGPTRGCILPIMMRQYITWRASSQPSNPLDSKPDR